MILLFDLDDTLLDFRKSEEVAFRAVLNKFSVPFSQDYYHEYRACSQALWKKVEEGTISKDRVRVERFENFFKSRDLECDAEIASECFLESLSSNPVLMDGAREVLDHLKNEYRLGVITNGIEEVQKRRLDRADLNGFFEHVVTSEQVGVAKPHPDIFVKTMGLFGEDLVKKYVMIGDRVETDIAGAREVGMKSVLFDPSENESRIQMPSDTLFISHLNQLPDLIKTI